ncbi:hypothetical protein OHA40_12565 [Nocardia sp. NBC_00508]|uniref:hypothetical protein n=1 Tax=Nocardia sp. NBC_00508 TaxID=2975992 RepID=UPI002E802EB5|nr:hypothetical protein [Nocardia sp. NBC_00508]WUD68874.1 hypothetical protein OHA40_12565 [Nocardia sp. NBC_00508]
MNRFAVKICAAFAVAAALGIGAAPVGANPGLPLDDATVVVAPIFVPDSGSAGPYNSFMCVLHTMSAQVPCMYT